MDRLETRRNLDQISVSYPEYPLQPAPLLDREDQKAFDDFLRQFDLDTHEPISTQPSSTHTTTASPLPSTNASRTISPHEKDPKKQTNAKQEPRSPSNISTTLTKTRTHSEQLSDTGTPTSIPSSPKTNRTDSPLEKSIVSESSQKQAAKRKLSDVTDIEPTSNSNTRPPGRGKKAPHELLSEKEKKANHIASEQKRRQNIRLGFEQLVEIVPTLSQSHRSESAILQKSVEYIHQLIAQRQQLKQRIRELRIAAGDPSDMIDDFSSSDEDIY